MEFEFTAEVESLDKVPADFQGLYSREGDTGPFKLRSGDAGVTSAVAAIAGLNNALKSERVARKAAQGTAIDISPLSAFGGTVEEIVTSVTTQIDELQGKVKGGAQLKVDLDKIKSDLASGHTKEIDAKDKVVTALRGQLHGLLVTNAALGALGDAIDPDLVMPFITERVQASEQDGVYSVHVVDAEKAVRYSGATGQPMSIGELVAEMKGNDKFKPLFKSDAKPGTGHPPGSSAAQIRPLSDKTKMSPNDKIAAGFRNRKK